MKKNVLLLGFLLSVGVTYLHASLDWNCSPNKAQRQRGSFLGASAQVDTDLKHVDVRLKRFWYMQVAQGNLSVQEKTPVQLGLVPFNELLIGSLDVESAVNGFRVKTGGKYLITLDYRIKAKNISGHLTGVLVTSPNGKNKTLFRIKEDGVHASGSQTYVRLSKGDFVGLAISELPKSGSVRYSPSEDFHNGNVVVVMGLYLRMSIL